MNTFSYVNIRVFRVLVCRNIGEGKIGEWINTDEKLDPSVRPSGFKTSCWDHLWSEPLQQEEKKQEVHLYGHHRPNKSTFTFTSWVTVCK